jgi:hypothetical protein
MPEDDPLLSPNDVARLWGTGLPTVVRLVASGQLASLDRGLLVGRGEYDVPLIRKSWAEALRRRSEGPSRVLKPPSGESFHPALAPAFEFHKALETQDEGGVYEYSSSASRAGRSPRELLVAWTAVGSHLLDNNAGVGTDIYSLAPHEAVAARVIADAPAMPRMVSKPTPALLVDALPLVFEDDHWRVDLPMFERGQEWVHLLSEAPPGSSSSPEPCEC